MNPKYQWGEDKILGHNTGMLLGSVWGKQRKTKGYLATWKQENNKIANRYYWKVQQANLRTADETGRGFAQSNNDCALKEQE